MKELEWIKKARELIGIEEVKGERHNPTIVKWLENMGEYSNESKAWWRDDETPWCGLFVAHILGQSGRYVVKEWYRAKEWAASQNMNWLLGPAYGCLAVMDRAGGGHIGFVVGKDQRGNIMVLGGNQNDQVSIAAFKPDRITHYIWPSRWLDGSPMRSSPHDNRYDLPLLKSDGTVSSNEA